jgi:hypothetical protein
MNFNFNNMENLFFFWALFIIATAVVHIVFAVGVLKDGQSIQGAGNQTVLVPFWVWALATLLGGAFVAVAYWAVHHSTLSRGNKI